MNIWIALPSFLFDKNTLTHKQALQIIFHKKLFILTNKKPLTGS